MTTFDSSKPTIFLDLDQTLISAEANNEIDLNSRKFKDKARLFNFEDMDGYYIIFERPGLQSFLTYLFSNFNVSIWTAASKDYALFIIEKFIIADHPERKLDYVFFSYHCNISKKTKKRSKDLSVLWDVYGLEEFDENNTFILDDYSEVHETQPDRCIIAEPFEFNDKNSHKDKFLKKLQKKLKKKLKTEGGISGHIEDINSRKV